MAFYQTGESAGGIKVNPKHLQGLMGNLKEFFGCFRIYGVTPNGDYVFLNEEKSNMETGALNDLAGTVLQNLFTRVGCEEGEGEDEEEEMSS